MGDRSQDQEMKAMGGDGQQTQAGRDAIALQNSQMTIHKSFISLFGNRPIAPDVNWKLAKTILKDQQATIEIRLKDSLFGLAEVDAVEVKAKRQEECSALALESVKSLSIDGIEVGTIDSQAPIISTYARKDIQGKLLILGTPGAGKTITLLKLAEQLVDEAIENPETIIPVIFELSTWRDGQSIEAWLIEQLYDLYGGKRERQVYETWLEQRVLLPLLDGLDELGMVRQKACTEKVNEFAKQYPQVVVCCRVKEFQQAGVNLSNLRGMVQLKPLNDRQIELYLAQMGKSGLWEQIQTVPEMGRLLEPVIDKKNPDYDEPGLLRVPLFISLAAQVYEQGQPLRGKKDLFDRYIDRQLSLDVREGDRRKELTKRNWAFKTVEQEPKREVVKRSLTWVARQLQRQNQVDLLIEKMQPSELGSNITKWQYRLIVGLIGGLIVGLIGGLIGGLVCGLIYGLTWGSLRLLGLQIISGPDDGIKYLQNMLLYEVPQETVKIMRRAMINGLIFGLVFGLVFGLICGLIFGLICGVFFWYFDHKLLILGLIYGMKSGLSFGIFLGFSAGIIGGLIGKIVGSKKQDLEIRSKPNLGIWNSLQHAMWATIFFYPISIILVAGIIGIKEGLAMAIASEKSLTFILSVIHISISKSIIPGIGVALCLGFLLGGGIPVIQHFCLRIVLTRHYPVPWNLARFLTYCHDRRLLQQIGGRYRFIHRELLEHFARIEN